MPSSFHTKIMVMPVFYQPVQTRRALETIHLFSFLNTLKTKCKLWPKMIYDITKLYYFRYENKTLYSNGSIRARCMRVKHSKSAARRVSIVWYHTGKNQSDCTNSLKYLRIKIKHWEVEYLELKCVIQLPNQNPKSERCTWKSHFAILHWNYQHPHWFWFQWWQHT